MCNGLDEREQIVATVLNLSNEQSLDLQHQYALK